MQIQLTVNPQDTADVNAGIAFLSSLIPAAERDAVRSTSRQPVGSVPVIAADDAPDVGAEPNKRGHARKVQPQVTEPSEANNSGSVASDTSTPSGGSTVAEGAGEGAGTTVDPAPSAPVKEHTIDDVRESAKAMMASKGEKPLAELLAKYGAGRISELAKEHYAAFIQEAV